MYSAQGRIKTSKKLALPEVCGISGAANIKKWGLAMAVDTSKGSPSMDYAEHVGTYRAFLKFTQFSIVALVLILLAMFLFLVPQHG